MAEKSYAIAQEKLDAWITVGHDRKSDYVLMHLYAKAAKMAFLDGTFDKMDDSYKTVFKKIQRDSTKRISIEVLQPEDCRPYGDGSILNIIQEASSNYSEAYFSDNFSHLPFNENKYETASQISERLLNTALLLNDAVTIDEVLESIEQTGSKLSWKKFLASKQRRNLNIPDSIIEKENNLKAELHFYKKAVFVNNETNEDKLKRYKEKLYDIEIEMEL